MPKVMSIGDDKDHDGYAFVVIRVAKDSNLFHEIIKMYRDNKIVNVEITTGYPKEGNP